MQLTTYTTTATSPARPQHGMGLKPNPNGTILHRPLCATQSAKERDTERLFGRDKAFMQVSSIAVFLFQDNALMWEAKITW